VNLVRQTDNSTKYNWASKLEACIHFTLLPLTFITHCRRFESERDTFVFTSYSTHTFQLTYRFQAQFSILPHWQGSMRLGPNS